MQIQILNTNFTIVLIYTFKKMMTVVIFMQKYQTFYKSGIYCLP